MCISYECIECFSWSILGLMPSMFSCSMFMLCEFGDCVVGVGGCVWVAV